eukprot:g48955.t1
MAQAEEIRTETGPLDYDYTEKEVELCQENLQNHKACSPDKIKNEMLKYRRPTTHTTLPALLHISYSTTHRPFYQTPPILSQIAQFTTDSLFYHRLFILPKAPLTCRPSEYFPVVSLCFVRR